MNSCVDCNTGAYVLFSSLALEKHFLACSFFLLYFILSHALDLCVCVCVCGDFGYDTHKTIHTEFSKGQL